MTSNLGSATIAALAGDEAQMKSKIMDVLRSEFRPEFLNRIDEIVIFKPLTRDELGEIVEIQLHRVSDRLIDRDISLQITPAAKSLIARLGYDPVYGARPLKRVIQKQILDPLSVKLIGGEVTEGEAVIIDERDGMLTFHAEMSEAPLVA